MTIFTFTVVFTTKYPMDKFDAIIIGAGTAGLSAGIALQKAGKNYVILDRKKEIGLPVRSTGALTTHWAKKLGMPMDKEIVTSPVKNVSFRTDTGKKISLRYDEPVGLIYDFTKYEKFLADKYAGHLNYRLETNVTSVDGSIVHTDDGDMQADLVIYASGPQSAFGPRLKKTEVLVAYEEIREVKQKDDYEMILWFTKETPGGYIWNFADSESTRKIGVCYYPLSGIQPKVVLDNFTSRNRELDGNMLHSMAHQIPLAAPVETVIRGNSLYVGDMVNAVLNTTAGGLQGAFWTGKIAGEAVVAGDLTVYQRKWDSEIRPWLLKHHNLHRRLHKKGPKSIGRIMTLAKFMPLSTKRRMFGGL
ncbi:MAG: NAD(P)/FAD-dependent oxidoreductase [Candidatus Thermoplasmatota archaeon]|nr:NAD(P)/FAD-dependent oxidoreductase [Candidatus Thermoplasmatota archaeon]